MTATAQNAEFYAGDTIDLEITVTDSDTGAAKNLTGATVRWVLYARVTGETLLNKSIGAGVTVTSAGAGQLTVRLDPVDTEDFAGIYGHECEVTDASGNVSTVTTGEIRIQESRA